VLTTLLKATLLGIVEGLTEFLPISSTGHMILVDAFVRLSESETFNVAFIVAIQLPAILAVVVYFWRLLWPFQKSKEERNHTLSLWTKIVVAFFPAAVLGFLFDDLLEKYLFNPPTVIAALIVGGIILIVLERRPRPHRFSDVAEVGYGRALAIGSFQCLAMIPGTSRSAATIIGAMLLGSDRKTAAEFSFFLAIPTMLGATTLKLVKNGFSFTSEQWAALAVGSIVSFIVAYASVAFLMTYIRSHDFRVFGYYRIALGLVILLILFL
jgi:undecaprenyl-diphosphatase